MTIKEMSKLCGLSQDTLRYYEKVGLIPTVNRTSGGIRDYDEMDLKWINFITKMKSCGISIDSLVQYVKLSLEGDSTSEERREILLEARRELESKVQKLNDCLDVINVKIDRYNHVLEVISNLVNERMEK